MSETHFITHVSSLAAGYFTDEDRPLGEQALLEIADDLRALAYAAATEMSIEHVQRRLLTIARRADATAELAQQITRIVCAREDSPEDGGPDGDDGEPMPVPLRMVQGGRR